MKVLHWIGTKISRLLAIVIAALLYVFLLMTTIMHASPAPFPAWLPFGFSTFISLVFLAVGAFVWLYARDRRVALLLFCFSCTAMVPFAVEMAALSNNLLFGVISSVSSVLALGFCAVLLLHFPKNYGELFFPSRVSTAGGRRPIRMRLGTVFMRGYSLSLVSLGCIAVSFPVVNYVWYPAPAILEILYFIYIALVIVGILVAILLAYFLSTTLREKQQLRLFVGGVVLSLVPFLTLTVLPQLLQLPEQFVIPAPISTLTVVLLPLSLGYSILRYQILVLDTYIRRTAAWVVGAICLAVLGYIIVAFCTILLSGNITLYVVLVTGLTLVLSPLTWWLARVVTGRLFFSEMQHYQRLIEKPAQPIDETLNLEEASRLLTVAAENTFETPYICLFALDEESGYYRVCPPLEDDPADYPRAGLVRSLVQEIKPAAHEQSDWIEVQLPAVERLYSAQRPLLLAEVMDTDRSLSPGLGRYLASPASFEGKNMLLAPVRSQGKMIGILILGDRGDHQPYAGPDFEAVQMLLSRFSPVLETARLYARANQHAALLNSLYSSTPGAAFQTIEQVVKAYAEVAAEATAARAEIWLDDEKNGWLHCIAAAGSGPCLVETESLFLAHERDWHASFFEGDDEQTTRNAVLPSCFSLMPRFPVAWLPLTRGEQRLGVLVLTYPRPHHFMKEETGVLVMFAHQFAATLVNVRMTIELRAAYERQKELDRLKDQFIMTASHELRTPLTAVQGYIELLNEYDAVLSAEMRASFIAKAQRGCDELTLLLGNIMDASRVQVEAKNVKLSAVALTDAVNVVLEILEAMTRREGRSIVIDLPDTLVMADDMRLRQVLLNLMSNALKYSPAGSPIEVTAKADADFVTIAVRDHGAGVPQEEQQRLFERFTRLERDINSPVRGAGLGLYICKQLVEAMGGQIWVESSGEPGEGSTFAFTLPCAVAQQSATAVPRHYDATIL